MLNGRESAFPASVLFNQNRTKPHPLSSRSLTPSIQYLMTRLTLDLIPSKHSSSLILSLVHSTNNFMSLSSNIFNQFVRFNQGVRFTLEASENTMALRRLRSSSSFNF